MLTRFNLGCCFRVKIHTAGVASLSTALDTKVGVSTMSERAKQIQGPHLAYSIITSTVHSLLQVISIFFLIGVVFVPVGVGCLISALKAGYVGLLSPVGFLALELFLVNLLSLLKRGLVQVVEVTRRYDDICIAGDNNAARESTLMQVGQKVIPRTALLHHHQWLLIVLVTQSAPGWVHLSIGSSSFYSKPCLKSAEITLHSGISQWHCIHITPLQHACMEVTPWQWHKIHVLRVSHISTPGMMGHDGALAVTLSVVDR